MMECDEAAGRAASTPAKDAVGRINLLVLYATNEKDEKRKTKQRE